MAPSQSKLNFKKDSPIRKTSPGKNSSKLAKRPQHVLTVVAFPPLPVELYVYRRGTDRDGYTGYYRQVIDGERESDDLIQKGFTQYYVHRLSQQVNAPKVGEDSWNCIVMVRYVPGMHESTGQTRAEGLAFLRGWLMDDEHSKYPPNDILTVDQTHPTHPVPMDNFLLDEHIFIVLRAVVDPNGRFFTDHPELARLFYSGPNYYGDAISMYGYGTVAPPVGPVDSQAQARDGMMENESNDLAIHGEDSTNEDAQGADDVAVEENANEENEGEENDANEEEAKHDRTSSRKASKKRR